MDYEALIEKQKETSKVHNEFLIDIQAYISLAPIVFNQTKEMSEEQKKARECIINRCIAISSAALIVKQLIEEN